MSARIWPSTRGVIRLVSPPVARDAGAADDRVDAVAVPLGVGLPLEHDHADALADKKAVGAPVERADLLAPGERAELAEDAPEAR